MTSDAAKEWHDIVRSDIKRVQAIYTAVGLFLVVLGYTLGLQHVQLQEQTTDLENVNRLVDYPWRKLEGLYLKDSFGDFKSRHVEPWYQACLATSVNLMAARKCNPQLDTPQTEETVKLITASGNELSYLNTKLSAIVGAQRLNTPFENLDSFKLRYLLDVFAFRPKDGKEKFDEGLTRAKSWSGSFLGHEFKICEGAEPTTALISIFQQGARADEFKPFREEYVVEDIRAFDDQDLNDQAVALMAEALDKKQISTLSQLYAKQVQLNREISHTKNDTSVSLPLVGIAVPVTLLGGYGNILTAVLLAYMILILKRIDTKLTKVYSSQASPDRDFYLALVAPIPFTWKRTWLSAAAIGLLLLTPSFIWAYFYFEQHQRTFRSLGTVSFGVTIYLAEALFITFWSRRIAQLSFIKT